MLLYIFQPPPETNTVVLVFKHSAELTIQTSAVSRMSWINFVDGPFHKHLNQLVLINETNAELLGNSKLMKGHFHS